MKSRSWTLGSSAKVRNEYSDYDYINKLNSKELRYLKAFHREYLNADFKHKYRKIHRKKKHIKNIYHMNNARNRCTYSIVKAAHMLWFGKCIMCKHRRTKWNHEDHMIAVVDLSLKKKVI